MLFRSPPPSLSITAPLSDAVASLSAAVDREARFAWEADEASLQLTEDGRLAGGEEYEPSYLEASGFRALVTRYNESFPRAHSLLASLTPPTVAAVWREAFRPSDGRVLVCERHPGEGQVSAVCAIYPPGWPVEYTVAHVARAALEALPERTPCRLQYDAANATLALTVMMPDFDVAITASDMYGEPAPAVHVIGKDGRNFGTPHIGPTRRRRPGTGGASTHDGLVNSIRAAHTVLR
jgi:hypothetical protein